MLKFKLIIVFLLTYSTAIAADHAIRIGCANNGNGTTWGCASSGGGTGAYNAIPSSLVRGDTYYFSSGTIDFSYTEDGYPLDDANSGTLFITFKAATVTTHGPSTGWSDSLVGQTIFKNTGAAYYRSIWFARQANNNGYYKWDGSYGSGPNEADYGFKMTMKETPGDRDHVLWYDQFSNGPVEFYHTAFIGYIDTAPQDVRVFTYMPDNSVIQYCLIDKFCNALHGASYGLTVDNCWFSNIWGISPIHQQLVSYNQDNLTFTNNMVINDSFTYWTGRSGDLSCNDAQVPGPTTHCDNWVIYNNVFVNSQKVVSDNSVSSDFHNFVFYNNTIVCEAGAECNGVVEGNKDDGSEVLIKNNIWYNHQIAIDTDLQGHSTHDYNFWDSTCTAVPGSSGYTSEANGKTQTITASNMFVSPGTPNYNYRLKSGSVAINAGVNLGTPFNIDKDGNTRVVPWDIGAYEYGASGGDVTAPTVTSVSVNGSTATINFSETVVTTGYDTGDFNIDCTSPTLTNVALSSPSGTGSTRTFTIATPIVYGQTCNLDYVGSAGDITDAASSPNNMVAVNDISVTNLTGAEFVESGWYTQIADTALLPGYAAYGTTIMLPYNGAFSPSSIPTYLNAAAAVGIKVWVDLRIEALALSESAFKAIINTNKNHSALKGWYISDEPELGGTSPATVTQYYNWAKSQDPNHPVAIAHANEPNAAYVGGYDVLVIDYYPGWTVSLPAEYNWMVRASYSRWKAGVDFAAAYGKTFIPAGLGFGYKISDGSLNNGVRDLTYGEYRYHVFSGIVQGVPAYLFWMDEWANSNIKSLVGQMINQINDIRIPMRSGATNTAAITCSQPTSKIQYRYGVSGNTHTLLAVNIAGYNVSDSGETLNNVTFTLPSGASTVTVLDESRTLTPSSSIITDNFSRFQVHVYQWTTSSGDYTTPTVTITTSDPQATVSDSLSVAWTDSDAVGVTLRKWRVGGYPSDSVGTTATSPATTSGYAQGANTLYVGARDAAGNWGYDSIVVNRDSIAPIIDNLSPSGVLACTSNPRNVTLSLTTNETATARMSLTDVSYGSMSDTFTNTNSTSHSEIKSLACGASYTYYVRTSDAIGNVNTSSSLISFSIASPQIAGPGGIKMIGGVKLTH